jgi:hypothetical protein
MRIHPILDRTLVAGASLAFCLCAPINAGAFVDPALTVFATTTTSCGPGNPGSTAGGKSDPSASHCLGIRISDPNSPSDFTFTGSASATAVTGRGTFILTTTANGTMSSSSPSAAQGISSSATGFMYFDLVEKSAPPFVGDVPVFVRVIAGASVDGNAAAAVLVKLDNTFLVNKQFYGFVQSGPHPFDESWSWSIDPSSGVHSIFKAASCTVIAGGNSPSGDCTASVDPILSLDQAAFDTRWGDETYSLENYYTIRVSSNLVPVPEPQIVALMLAGAVLVGLRLRKARMI